MVEGVLMSVVVTRVIDVQLEIVLVQPLKIVVLKQLYTTLIL